MALLAGPKSFQEWYTDSSNTGAAQIVQNTYDQALLYFDKELSHGDKKDLSWIHQTHSIDQVIAVAETATSTYSTAAASSSIKRTARQWMVAFSSRLVYYGQVLDTLAQHHPEYVALVWGAIKFVLHGVLNHAEILAEFAKAMSEIGDALPRIDLQARLYPSTHVQHVIARVYAHIMLFMQQAVKWYHAGSFRRMLSSFTKPWSLNYQDTIEQIRRLVVVADANSATAAGAELRGVSLSLRAHDAKLDELRTLVNQMLDVTKGHYSLSQDMSIKIDDQTLRLCDLQFSEILSIFRPERLPTDVLHSCQSIAKRRKLWSPSALRTNSFVDRLKDWCSAAGSLLFVVQAGLRAEAITKDLVLETVTFFQASSFRVIWFFSERLSSNKEFGIGQVLKSLIYQILDHDSDIVQKDPQNVNISRFRQLSESELQDLLVSLLLCVPKCFVVVETESLYVRSEDGQEWCRQLERTFQSIVDKVDTRNGTAKILLVSYSTASTSPTEDQMDRRLTTVVRTNKLPIAKARMMNSRHPSVMRQMTQARARLP